MTPTADQGLRDAARDAYVWGYPLVVMHRTRARFCSRFPVGRLHHSDHLSTPANRGVVAPNNDTLYSSGWFDLREGPLVIDVPPIDRYWSAMVLDAYTHVAYVCRRTHGTRGCSVQVTLDPSREPPRRGTDVVPMATPTVWVLVRTLVEGPHDMDAARAIQRSIAITPPGDHPLRTIERGGRPNEVHLAGAAFFEELAKALKVDPPAQWHPKPSEFVLRVIEGWRDADQEVLAEGVAEGEKWISGDPLASNRFGNGWGTNTSGSDFGDDVRLRATTAKYGLAAHHPIENRAYVLRTGAKGQPADGTKNLHLHFPPGQPPCNGFWSLTAYGPDMYLVENEIQRYAIGDRTPGLRYDSKGGLDLIVGGARPNDISNWLPTPAGPYVLGLRVYEGHREVVDASWFPPPLTVDHGR